MSPHAPPRPTFNLRQDPEACASGRAPSCARRGQVKPTIGHLCASATHEGVLQQDWRAMSNLPHPRLIAIRACCRRKSWYFGALTTISSFTNFFPERAMATLKEWTSKTLPMKQKPRSPCLVPGIFLDCWPICYVGCARCCRIRFSINARLCCACRLCSLVPTTIGALHVRCRETCRVERQEYFYRLTGGCSCRNA